MSIIRVKKDQKYFVASNALFNDKDLSWEARGVMGYLLSKPDGWQCRNYDLINQGPAGEHAIKRILKELKEAGYIHRFKISKGRGKIEWITEIYEAPDLNPNFTTGDFTTVENIEVEKSADIVSTNPQKVLTIENTEATSSKNLNTLADKIATVTRSDIDTIGGSGRKQLKRIALALSKKPNLDAKLIAYEKWWYANDWRGKQGQPPTVWTMGDTWGQFEADKVGPTNGTTNNGPVLSEAEKTRLAELVAENAK